MKSFKEFTEKYPPKIMLWEIMLDYENSSQTIIEFVNYDVHINYFEKFYREKNFRKEKDAAHSFTSFHYTSSDPNIVLKGVEEEIFTKKKKFIQTFKKISNYNLVLACFKDERIADKENLHIRDEGWLLILQEYAKKKITISLNDQGYSDTENIDIL